VRLAGPRRSCPEPRHRPVVRGEVASRAQGGQEWLSFYFKSPQHALSVCPEHDLFIQQTKLKNTLRWLMGEEQITHLGMEYYHD
jgi:myo-inositol-1-phosphate synthase